MIAMEIPFSSVTRQVRCAESTRFARYFILTNLLTSRRMNYWENGELSPWVTEVFSNALESEGTTHLIWLHAPQG
jgi:hypothetical protein